MTGFGRCEIADEKRKFTVELKSVNHRYLDVNMKMPKKLNFFESAIRSLLKNILNEAKWICIFPMRTIRRTIMHLSIMRTCR